jgi:thiol-disulfide isomerase/thioredoxin
LLLALLLAPATARGQDPASSPREQQTVGVEAPPVTISGDEISPAVREVLNPVFQRVANAQRIRATTKLELTTSVGDEVLDTSEGLFQMASQVPNLLSLMAKFDNETVQLLSNGESLFLQFDNRDYVQTDAPASLNSFVAALPIQLGPQPDTMLWLSVAGMEPEQLLLEGLTAIEVTDGEPLDGETTRVVEATRAEGVTWQLRVTTGDDPRPISLLIDMTGMITRANQLDLPEGYAFRMRYSFDKWIVDGPLETDWFEFQTPEGATRYESLEAYQEAANRHPLLGKQAPGFKAETLSGEAVELTDKPEEVVVLDFWATWCGPCREALPELKEVVASFSGQPLRFYAVNVQEEREAIKNFLKDSELGDLPVVLDPEGEVTRAFATTAIPQTVLIGKDGRVEAVHVGFDSDQSLDALREEIETLLEGGRLFEPAAARHDAAESEPSESGSEDAGN